MIEIKSALAAILVTIGLVSVPVAAQANGTSASPNGNYSVNGVSFYNYALVQTSNGFATGYTYSAPVSKCVIAGGIAVQARLIQNYQQSAEVLVSSSAMSYSDRTLCGAQTWQTSASYAGKGNFYSKGISWAFNYSSYAYEGFQTLPTGMQTAN